MSTKEAVLELIRQLPEDVTFQDILAALTSHAGDVTDDEWRLFVAQGLADELNDPRQDIYTLDDGTPNDVPR